MPAETPNIPPSKLVRAAQLRAEYELIKTWPPDPEALTAYARAFRALENNASGPVRINAPPADATAA